MTLIEPTLQQGAGIPRGPVRRGRPVGWWGVVGVIATEASIFVALLGAYFYVRATSPQWPQGGIEEPKLLWTSLFSIALFASSIPLLFTERAMERNQLGKVQVALAFTFVLGLAFLTNQLREYRELHFGLRDDAYGSLFYLITGLHGLHVLVGLLLNLVVQAKVAARRISPERHQVLSVSNLYWHFVDGVWLVVFVSLYLTVSLR